MDPSFYYQPPQPQNLMPKMSKMNPPAMQNLKPGYTYQETPLYNYSQANNQLDPQMDLYRAAQVYNYPEQHNQANQYQPTVKQHKNPKTGNLITEVWRQNLEEEFNRIMDLIEEFPLIALVILTFSAFIFLILISLNRIQSSLVYLMATIRFLYRFKEINRIFFRRMNT